MRRELDLTSVPTVRFLHAARVCVLCAVLAIGAVVWMGTTAPFKGGPEWHRPLVQPILALELPADTDELKQLLHGVAGEARDNTSADRWFILAYGVFFLSLAYAHNAQHAPYRDVLWFSTVVLTAVTVLFDLQENWLIVRNIALIEEGAPHADVIVLISAVKWFAFFGVALLAAPIFTRRVDWPFAVGAGLTFFSSVGMIGCLGLAITMSSRAVITVALYGVVAALIPGILVLAMRPARLLPPTAAGEAPAAAPEYIASPAAQNRRATSGSQPA